MLLTMTIAAVVLTAVAGIYCILVTHNLLRVLIAMEIVNKAAILLLVLAGSLKGELALVESYIFALIIIEVVVTAIGAVLCIAIHAHTGSLDIRRLNDAVDKSKKAGEGTNE